jgi:DNA-binding beta-propeller fold protein YncE
MSQDTGKQNRFGLGKIGFAALTLVAVAAVAGVFWSQSQVSQLQTQLSTMAPGTVVQAGALQAAPAGAQPSGWDTAESIRGGLQVVATYDSSGPDAWDPGKHPTVFMTSEGRGYAHRPSKTNEMPGVQIVDAYTKETVGSALFDLGGEPTRQPHGLGISPNGKWIYLGFADKTTDGTARQLTLIVNARTLKLDKVLAHTGGQNLHHIIGFIDYAGQERVVLEYGFGSDGGPHFIIDPNDDNKVLKAITMQDIGYKMGHPFLTADPTGKSLYISLVAPAWRTELHNTGGIAKLDMETWDVTVVPYTGDHPIGIVHTADGKFTYVADGHGSHVYKIDNELNEVVANTSAGVAGPYGLALNWDETELYVVGKGEGSHNTGGVLGLIETKTFLPSRAINQPINIGGAIVDHATLHPDPAVNELWVTSSGTWETIILDLNTKEVKARIPTPHGGDTHSGAFIRYTPDFVGVLLSDHGGLSRELYKERMDRAAKAAAAAVAQP